MKRTIPLLLCVTLLTGCSTVPVYHSPSSSEPGAILRFQSLEGLSNFGSDAVYPIAINGNQMSSWRLSNTIRLMPGKNYIDVAGESTNKRTMAYAKLELDVKAGENYLVKREVEIENIHFFVIDSSGKVVAESRGVKKPITAGFLDIPYIQYQYK